MKNLVLYVKIVYQNMRNHIHVIKLTQKLWKRKILLYRYISWSSFVILLTLVTSRVFLWLFLLFCDIWVLSSFYEIFWVLYLSFSVFLLSGTMISTKLICLARPMWRNAILAWNIRTTHRWWKHWQW